jgi:hypothetical protein
MNRFPKRMKNQINSLDPAEKYNFIFLLALVIIGVITTFICAIIDLDNKFLLRIIELQISSICIAIIWERYGILLKIDSGIKSILSKREISFRKNIEKEHPLDEMWNNATEIRIAAMACSVLFSNKRETLVGALKNKTSIELVIINPSSKAFLEQSSNKMINEFGIEKQLASSSIDALRNFSLHNNARFKYFLTDVNLPYAIMIVNKKNRNEGFIKVDLYAVDVYESHRPCIIIPYSDSEMYHFFQEQYESIKRHAYMDSLN